MLFKFLSEWRLQPYYKSYFIDHNLLIDSIDISFVSSNLCTIFYSISSFIFVPLQVQFTNYICVLGVRIFITWYASMGLVFWALAIWLMFFLDFLLLALDFYVSYHHCIIKQDFFNVSSILLCWPCDHVTCSYYWFDKHSTLDFHYRKFGWLH